ncbi:MAG: type II toxin-antitoxin system prevent-host-death family antitoxin [Candidatus Omnitrophota bacterium]
MNEINALELRKRFGQILDEVRYGKKPYVITKNGRRVAVLVDFDLFKNSGSKVAESMVEEYGPERIREFMTADVLDKNVRVKAKKRLRA